MRRLSWVLWLLLALVVVTPGLRFAYGGSHATGFSSKAHVYRETFVKTPWISAPDSAFRLRSVVVGSSVGSTPTLPALLIARPPFVPPEA
jgi:hypothetical protein